MGTIKHRAEAWTELYDEEKSQSKYKDITEIESWRLTYPENGVHFYFEVSKRRKVGFSLYLDDLLAIVEQIKAEV